MEELPPRVVEWVGVDQAATVVGLPEEDGVPPPLGGEVEDPRVVEEEVPDVEVDGEPLPELAHLLHLHHLLHRQVQKLVGDPHRPLLQPPQRRLRPPAPGGGGGVVRPQVRQPLPLLHRRPEVLPQLHPRRELLLERVPELLLFHLLRLLRQLLIPPLLHCRSEAGGLAGELQEMRVRFPRVVSDGENPRVPGDDGVLEIIGEPQFPPDLEDGTERDRPRGGHGQEPHQSLHGEAAGRGGRGGEGLLAGDLRRGLREADDLVGGGVAGDGEDVRVPADEVGGAAVEVELLGGGGEEGEGEGAAGGGEYEVLDGGDLEEVLVAVHQLLEGGVPRPCGNVLRRSRLAPPRGERESGGGGGGGEAANQSPHGAAAGGDAASSAAAAQNLGLFSRFWRRVSGLFFSSDHLRPSPLSSNARPNNLAMGTLLRPIRAH